MWPLGFKNWPKFGVSNSNIFTGHTKPHISVRWPHFCIKQIKSFVDFCRLLRSVCGPRNAYLRPLSLIDARPSPFWQEGQFEWTSGNSFELSRSRRKLSDDCFHISQVHIFFYSRISPTSWPLLIRPRLPGTKKQNGQICPKAAAKRPSSKKVKKGQNWKFAEIYEQSYKTRLKG